MNEFSTLFLMKIIKKIIGSSTELRTTPMLKHQFSFSVGTKQARAVNPKNIDNVVTADTRTVLGSTNAHRPATPYAQQMVNINHRR